MSTDEKKVTGEEVLGLKRDESGIITLESGVRIRLKPVAAVLIAELQNRISDPTPPITVLEDGREISDVSSKDYLRKLQETDDKRAQVALEALAILGIDLIDGLPEDETWLDHLIYLKVGGLEPGVELSQAEKTFLYKKYVVAHTGIIFEIGRLSGVSAAQVDAAKRSFQG